MNRTEWRAIEEARKILQLGDRATLGEMKRAYHRLSKLYHPDLQQDEARSVGDAESSTGEREAQSEQMYRLTSAYGLLMRYCQEYRFPLQRDDLFSDNAALYDPEDWWHARFGQDSIWAGCKTRRR